MQNYYLFSSSTLNNSFELFFGNCGIPLISESDKELESQPVFDSTYVTECFEKKQGQQLAQTLDEVDRSESEDLGNSRGNCASNSEQIIEEE